MSDIVEDLRYAEHVTDERVMKVMDAGADTIESLRQQLIGLQGRFEKDQERIRCQAEQLAAAQAREQQLREAYVLLENFAQSVGGSSSFWEDMNDKLEPASVIANFGKADTSALEAMISKSGEVMRERCIERTKTMIQLEVTLPCVRNEIRALPGVTMEDMK